MRRRTRDHSIWPLTAVRREIFGAPDDHVYLLTFREAKLPGQWNLERRTATRSEAAAFARRHDLVLPPAPADIAQVFPREGVTLSALTIGSTPIPSARSLTVAINLNQPQQPRNIMSHSLMQYFAFSHLPPHLQVASRPVGELAEQLDHMLPDCAEKTAGMRKLLEAKDCFVRASLPARVAEPKTIPPPPEPPANIDAPSLL